MRGCDERFLYLVYFRQNSEAESVLCAGCRVSLVLLGVSSTLISRSGWSLPGWFYWACGTKPHSW